MVAMDIRLFSVAMDTGFTPFRAAMDLGIRLLQRQALLYVFNY